MSLTYNEHYQRLYHGDALDVLSKMPSGRVQCCVTSPPYYQQRVYDVDGEIGWESTPEGYLNALAKVFWQVRRVLRDDGTLWLNMGDKMKGKKMLGLPWRMALHLQNSGWYLRSDLIWSKPNPMPSSVTDRPTTAHEYVFLLSKKSKYFYNTDALRTPYKRDNRKVTTVRQGANSQQHRDGERWPHPLGANARTVWRIPPEPTQIAAYAVMPEGLARKCVKGGSRHSDFVLDPFCGAGSTLIAALAEGRRGIGIDLNADDLALAARRIGARAASIAPHGCPTPPRAPESARGGVIRQGEPADLL